MVEPLSLFQVATGNRSRSMLNTDGFCFPGSVHQKNTVRFGSAYTDLHSRLPVLGSPKLRFCGIDILFDMFCFVLLTYKLYS